MRYPSPTMGGRTPRGRRLAGGMGSRLLATSSATGSSTERKRTWGQCIPMGGTSFAYSGTELHAFTEADNYYRWILSEFAHYLRERIIEVGAGIGTFSEFLLHGTNCILFIFILLVASMILVFYIVLLCY